ncbi:MAG: 50S ribosomal protein L6 [Candidatus Uhrbacteria bacterium]|nr:50S ribosomal protein L6 [Candidatus Uhrbacteria bacterium]
MSRVGKKPIVIPKGVDVTIIGQTVKVKGPKGELMETLNAVVRVMLTQGEDGQEIQFAVDHEDEKFERAQWGTARALVANMIEGVTNGFSKKLEINGVGYRVNLQGRTLILNVGFSHDVRVELPVELTAEVDGNLLTISGMSKHMVGSLADTLRKIRPPEPYKGKGIKYVEETIRRKAGKSQKAGE